MASTKKLHSKTKQNKKSSGDHDIKDCPHELNHKFIHKKMNTALDDKKFVKVYNSDGSRVLVVPERKPLDIAGIWPSSEYERLKQQANVVTLKDRIAMIDEAEKKKVKMQIESEQRKAMLEKVQVHQQAMRGSVLDNVDSEAKSKNEGLLRRSYEMMVEQDERVKEANRAILARKCHFIRNAQLAEKELMQKQLQEEDQRLDLMMEQYRQKKYMEEAKKMEEEELKKQKVFEEVTRQIKEIEINKLAEAEKVEEESKLLNKVLIAIQMEKDVEEQKKRKKQIELRDDYLKTYQEMERYKQIQEEEQRIADMRIQEFMRKKQEREEAKIKELEQIRKAKERDQERLGAAQKKAAEKEAELIEMTLIKYMEEKERVWREQEKQAALKKKKQIENLKVARDQQILDIRKSQALAIAKDEEDFHRNAKIQYEQFKKEQQDRKNKRQLLHKFHKGLLRQINEKERMRIKEFQEKFEEGRAQRLDLEMKDRQVEEYLKAKVQKLRDGNLPEAYIQDIEKQLKLR